MEGLITIFITEIEGKLDVSCSFPLPPRKYVVCIFYLNNRFHGGNAFIWEGRVDVIYHRRLYIIVQLTHN